MVCHWPGIYYNGDKLGFKIFKTVVDRLEQKYGSRIHWMKLSEIANYWAAKEFVTFERNKKGLRIHAPFGANDFTIVLDKKYNKISIGQLGDSTPLKEIPAEKTISTGSFHTQNGRTVLCFNLSPGESEIICT